MNVSLKMLVFFNKVAYCYIDIIITPIILIENSIHSTLCPELVNNRFQNVSIISWEQLHNIYESKQYI